MIATKYNLARRIQPPTARVYDLILYETLKDKDIAPLTAQQIAKLAGKGGAK